MVFVLLGVALVIMKLLDFGPAAVWPWWWVLSPFAGAVIWWAWADMSGYTKRREMDKMEDRKTAQRRVRSIETECRVAVELREVVYFPPSEFAPDLVASVRQAAQALGFSHRDIVSGAAHDAVYLSRVAPTAMCSCPARAASATPRLRARRPRTSPRAATCC